MFQFFKQNGSLWVPPHGVSWVDFGGYWLLPGCRLVASPYWPASWVPPGWPPHPADKNWKTGTRENRKTGENRKNKNNTGPQKGKPEKQDNQENRKIGKPEKLENHEKRKQKHINKNGLTIQTVKILKMGTMGQT